MNSVRVHTLLIVAVGTLALVLAACGVCAEVECTGPHPGSIRMVRALPSDGALRRLVAAVLGSAAAALSSVAVGATALANAPRMAEAYIRPRFASQVPLRV